MAFPQSRLVFGCLLLLGAAVAMEASGDPGPPASAATARTKRILVIGDSWAAGMTWPFGGVFQPTLDKNDYNHVATVATLRTAIPGSAAAQWAANFNGNLDHAKSVLQENPSIDIVFMTLGGNDFNGVAVRRNVLEMGAEEREKLYVKIAADIAKVIDELLAVRPDMRVVLCEYDYFNLDANARSPIRLNFQGLTQEQYNKALVDLGRHKKELAGRRPGRVLYVHNWGVNQHAMGDASHGYGPRDVPAPGGPPEYDPYPGGDVSKPGPAAAFQTLLVNDGFHLNPGGYSRIIENALNQGLGAMLKDRADVEPAR